MQPAVHVSQSYKLAKQLGLNGALGQSKGLLPVAEKFTLAPSWRAQWLKLQTSAFTDHQMLAWRMCGSVCSETPFPAGRSGAPAPKVQKCGGKVAPTAHMFRNGLP